MSYSTSEPVTLSPMDEENQRLISQVHPPNWVNPKPAKRYNLVIIGAGTAGLVTAAGSAGLGAKVALIEKHLMGGDCLNSGCVPSKAVIRSARIAAEIRDAQRFGIQVGSSQVDFATVMARMRRLRAGISVHDSAPRFQKLGVDVFLGAAKFTSDHTVEVGGQTIAFKKAVIATGARPVEPAIPGLAKAGFLTNETVFSLTELPKKLAVIGAGPIGCELAQAFQRLGTQVVLFHNKSHILDREDADAAEIVQTVLTEEGIQLILNAQITQVALTGQGKVINYNTGQTQSSATVDEILLGAGRAPNVEDLNLETVGVHYHPRKGIFVNDYLQTSNPRIYAAGDVCMDWKFTHAADFAARIVIQNALFGGGKKLSALTMPWCTYTDPEIAHVGLYPREAKEKGVNLDTYIIPFAQVDRAITDGEETGFVKIHVKQGKDHIVGATIVGRHAGDLISEITVAMAGKVGLGKLAGVIHPYPTLADAIRKAGDAYNRTRLTPFVKQLFSTWLSLIR